MYRKKMRGEGGGVNEELGMEAGLSITEMIFTLSILGCLLMLAAPGISSISQRIERELFLQFFVSELNLAQMEAIARQEDVSVQIDAKGIFIKQGDAVLRTVKIPQRYVIESNYVDNRICFRKTGQVLGGTIWLLKERERVGQVIVSVASGRSRIKLLDG